MHNYSIDSSERITVISVLGILGVYIANFINPCIKEFVGFITHLSPFLIFSILFSLYNFILWKWIARIHFLNTTPNFNGNYKGNLKSSFNNYQVEYPTDVTVKQTWTQIVIKQKTKTSTSCSVNASISIKTKCDPTIYYFYQNDPNIDSVDTMEMHYGSCEHVWDRKTNTFNAWYFSGRGRKNFGVIELKKEKKKCGKQ